jgi:hypothetical protein
MLTYADVWRVAQVRQVQLRGARASSPDTRTLRLDDVLRLQKGLARETAALGPKPAKLVP